MANNKRYISKQFPAIESSLQKIAKIRNISEVVVIEQFKKDIQNFNVEGYEKNIKEITIKKMSEPTRIKLIEFLDELIKQKKAEERSNTKRMEQQENNERTKKANEIKWNQVKETIDDIMSSKKESSRLECVLIVMEDIRLGTFNMELTRKEKRYILKKLEEMEAEEIKKQQEQTGETKKQNEANKIWAQIGEKISNQSAKGNRPEVEYWIAIRNQLFDEEEGKMQKDTRMSKEVKKKVKKMIDNEIYYQDVKYYTEDFRFLRDFPEVALGNTPRRGFSDMKSLLRYDDLRVELQTTWDEYRKITELLENETDDANIRILQARKAVIEKQRKERAERGK